MMDKTYSGLCIGGPMDGTYQTSKIDRLTVLHNGAFDWPPVTGVASPATNYVYEELWIDYPNGDRKRLAFWLLPEDAALLRCTENRALGLLMCLTENYAKGRKAREGAE